MQIVTIFRDISTVSQAFHRPLSEILKRIKNGSASRNLIEQIRVETDKTKRNELKKSLPSICFCGKFKKRSIKGLIEHSGLICLDFDNFETPEALEAYREILKLDAYVYSVFVSPSGNGLKVLVKIPPSAEFHKQYFKTLMSKFDVAYFDKSTSDVSRVCYESYDPELYINENALMWEELPIEKELKGDVNPSIPITSEYEKVQRIQVWFDANFSVTSGNRNTNLFKFAASMNSFGVSKSTAEQHLHKYSSSDFTTTEITAIVNSAYKKTSAHGEAKFEDNRKTEKISQAVKSGKSKEEIVDELDVSEKDIQKVRSKMTTETFWEFTNKGAVKISHHDFKLFLQEEGFGKYYPNIIGKHTLIRIKNGNIIQAIEDWQVKDYVLKYLQDNFKDFGKPVFNYFSENTKYFKDDFLSFLDPINIEFNKDTIDNCYLYYKNVAIEISKEGIKKINYEDLSGFVWENQIINREFSETGKYDVSVFKKFLENVSSNDKERFASIISALGYLLHSFKNSSNNRAIILNDETISDDPNGGSGKGLFAKAISYMKKLSTIDGKNFSFEKSFAYQTVSPDTQVLFFDDVKRNFQFENLFSIITEGIVIEKKNKDALYIPIDRSPKILISTNYTIGGASGSHNRRKFELEFSSHYNDSHTPYDDFGHMLFDEWSVVEWQNFDSFMVKCVQYYLKNGLKKSEFKNLHQRKFIKETCIEFYSYAIEDECLEINTRLSKSTSFDKFRDEYPDVKKWLGQKSFIKFVKSYCKYVGYNYLEGNSTFRWFEIENQNIPRSENNEQPF